MISINRKNPTAGEITSSLTNASDAAGLHFDGAAGYVSCGDSTILDGATKMSLEVIAATSATSAGLVLGKTYESECFYVRFDADGKLRAVINNSSGNGIAVSAGTYNDGNPKHIVVTWDAATVSIYVNGNLDGTATLADGSIPNTTDLLGLGAQLHGNGTSRAAYFDGIIYRARLFNYVIDPTRFYENSTVPFADQYGVATNKITGAVDKNWGTDQADTGNDANDRTTFESNYVWNTNLCTDISVASNVLQFSTAALNKGVYYNTTLLAGKRYRVTIGVGAITGTTYGVYTYATGYTKVGSLVASTTNSIDFVAESGNNGNILIVSDSATAGTIQLDASSVSTEIVAAGCVADYDCAFSNPEISFMVQDRAGAADGTASSGVTQVTPIEQLNSKSARIGTSAATPADGDLLVSGNVGVGTATPGTYDSRAERLVIHEAGDGGITIATGAASDGRLVFAQSGDTGLDHGEISYDQNTEAMGFATAGTGRLTIDSAGKVGVGVTPEAWHSTYDALDIGEQGSLAAYNSAPGGSVFLGRNTYYDGSHKYKNTDEASLIEQSGDGRIKLRVAASGTADAAITWTDALLVSNTGLSTFSAGIAFQSATTGSGTGTGYTLDSYEEGTWTPTITGATTAGTYTYTSNLGYYTRVGNVVTIQFSIWDINASSAGSGDLKINGMPFPTRNVGYATNIGVVGTDSIDYNGYERALFMRANDNLSHMNLYEVRDNATDVTVPVTAIASGTSDIYGTMTYLI